MIRGVSVVTEFIAASRDRWREPYTVLSLCIGSYFAVRFAQVVIGPVIPLVLETFPVSRGAIGTVLTGMWIGYALAQLPSSVLADRFGEHHLVLAALAMTAAASLGLAATPSFLLFGGGAVVVGIGAGTYYNPATALLTREFEGIGGAIGTHRIGGQVAGVLAPLVVALVTLRYGWRTAIALGALITIVVGALFGRIHTQRAPLRPEASLRELFDVDVVTTLLSRSHTRYTTAMMALVEFAGLAAMAFVPTLLVEHYGFSVSRANVLFAVLFAVSAICQPLGGRLSDRIGRDRTLAIQTSAGVVGYGALATGTTLYGAVPGVVLVGVAMSATPVLQSRMMDGLSETTRGTGFGLFRTLYLLLGASGTAVVGTIADGAGWGSAFGVLSLLFGVIVVSVVVFDR